MERVIIYARVSSREQEETGYSLDAQENLLKEYATKHGYKIAKTFRVSESASTSVARKTFAEMLRYANEHKVNIILCEKIDRLTRNLKDAATASDWVLEADGREIHFVKENFVVSKDTKAHENFVWDMKVAMARFYTNNLSEEVRKGQKEKLRQGWLPAKPPTGYKTVGEKGHKIHVLDEDRAPFIKRAFELYSTGSYSLAKLADKMYAEGLRTRTGHKLASGRLHEIFQDPFYYGEIRWNGSIYAGAHESLIDRELFEKVRDARVRKVAPKYQKHQFQFRKMLVCGECNGTITAEIQKGTVYYHCSHYQECSQKKFTHEKEIEESLYSVFKFFEAITAEEAEAIRLKIKASHAEEIEYKENVIKSLSAQYSRLQRRLDNLYNDRLDEKITPQFWEAKNKEILAEQEEIQEQLRRLKSEETKYFEMWLNIIDLALRAREIYERRSPEDRRLLLTYIFSNLVLKDQKVTYTLTPAVQKLAERVQERLDTESSFEPKKTLTRKRQKNSSESLHPALLALQGNFRTINRAKEFPYPTLVLQRFGVITFLKQKTASPRDQKGGLCGGRRCGLGVVDGQTGSGTAVVRARATPSVLACEKPLLLPFLAVPDQHSDAVVGDLVGATSFREAALDDLRKDKVELPQMTRNARRVILEELEFSFAELRAVPHKHAAEFFRRS